MSLLKVRSLTKHYKVSTGLLKPKTLVKANQEIDLMLVNPDLLNRLSQDRLLGLKNQRLVRLA
jgi:hypothetical protein